MPIPIASPIGLGLRYSVSIPNDLRLQGLKLWAQAFCACRMINGRGPFTSTSVISFQIQ